MTTASDTTTSTDPEPSFADLAADPAPVVPAAVSPADPAPADTPDPDGAAPDTAGWTDPSEWEHGYLDFHGDKLAFRVPSEAVISAYGLAAGPGSSPVEQTRYTRKFLERHLSAVSLDRVLDRMMNPDDADYGGDALGDLTTAISKPLIDRLEAEAEARKKAAKSKK